MTQFADIFAALAAPFDPSELKTRQQAGRTFTYITARTVMNRLDDVLGAENWWDTYAPSGHSVMCALTIQLPDGRVVTKCDAGGKAGMADDGDDEKSAHSDAFKRAAVKLGVGRYLYRDGVPKIARERYDCPEFAPDTSRSPGRQGGRSGGGNTGGNGQRRQERREPPPQQDRQGKAPQSAQAPPSGPRGHAASAETPRSGRELFAWVKDREEEYPGMLKYLLTWASGQNLPDRIVAWDAAAAMRGHAELLRQIDRKHQHEEALAN